MDMLLTTDRKIVTMIRSAAWHMVVFLGFRGEAGGGILFYDASAAAGG
jgi:hypothetical protein